MTSQCQPADLLLTVFSNGLECSLQDIVVYNDVQEGDAIEVPNAVQWRQSNGEEKQ